MGRERISELQNREFQNWLSENFLFSVARAVALFIVFWVMAIHPEWSFISLLSLFIFLRLISSYGMAMAVAIFMVLSLFTGYLLGFILTSFLYFFLFLNFA